MTSTPASEAWSHRRGFGATAQQWLGSHHGRDTCCGKLHLTDIAMTLPCAPRVPKHTAWGLADSAVRPAELPTLAFATARVIYSALPRVRDDLRGQASHLLRAFGAIPRCTLDAAGYLLLDWRSGVHVHGVDLGS